MKEDFDENYFWDLSILIHLMKDNKPIDTATGFFFGHNNKSFFVTCKHVLYPDNEKYRPDSLNLRLSYDRSSDPPKHDWFTLNLYDEHHGKTWLDHKDDRIDLALISDSHIKPSSRITDNSGWAYGRCTLTERNIIPKGVPLFPGEDISIFGFPNGQGNEKYNQGLCTRGYLTSNYYTDFNGEPCSLVSGDHFPGMSGSPVLTKIKTMIYANGKSHIVEPTCFLLGVYSGKEFHIPSEAIREVKKTDEKVNAYRVFPAKYLIEIINQIN